VLVIIILWMMLHFVASGAVSWMPLKMCIIFSTKYRIGPNIAAWGCV
jgi:hypothetical protein